MMSNNNGEIAMSKEPKTYIIPSRSYGISSNEAVDILVAAEEIKQNKPLLRAA